MSVFRFIPSSASRLSLGLCLFLAALLMIAVMRLGHLFPPVIEDVTLVSSEDVSAALAISLPYTKESEAGEDLYYRITLRNLNADNAIMRIIPDDCLEALAINEKQVELPSEDRKRCNYYTGITVNLFPYLESSKASVELLIRNHGGSTALTFYPVTSNKSIWAMTMIAWLVILSLLIWFSSYMQFDRIEISMLAGVLFVYLMQFYAAAPWDYANDFWQHFRYIKSIAMLDAIPAPDTHITRHPFLYHLISGILLKLNLWLGIPSPFLLIQHFSLALLLGFILFGRQILKLLLPVSSIYYMALAMFLFWPAGFILVGNINNDIGVYFLASGLLYYLMRWDMSKRTDDLGYALLFCALIMLTKEGGILYLALIVVVVFHHLYTGQARFSGLTNMRIASSLGLIILAECANIVRALNYGDKIGGSLRLFTSVKISDSPYNSLNNFLLIDMGTFLKEPFIDSYAPSREYFWNYFLKTLLFGNWVTWEGKLVAIAINISLLILLAFILMTAFFWVMRWKQRPEKLFIISFACFLLVAGLMYFRYRYPVVGALIGPSNHARYIYHIIIPLTALYAKACEWHYSKGHVVLARLGWFTGGLLAAMSLAFQGINVYTSMISPRF